jgi:GR25 family glycosyltransferase involved in LPS biosynthesis
MGYIEQNQKLFPFIKIFKSVNGYNIDETLNEMRRLKLKYVKLDNNGFTTFGTLANWITKYKMLKFQVDNKIHFICFIEDDLILDKNFNTYIHESLCHFKKNHVTVNILRMMKWGEGYITSYESAKRVLEHLDRDGIVRNIDNQLRLRCGKEMGLQNAPMRLMVRGNNGDCLKTSKFNNSDICNMLR